MTGVESGEPGAGSDRGPAVIAVVFTALVLAVGVGWWNWPEKTPPVQLDVDFSGAVLEVREAIETARDRVRLAPESGEAWGELAMLLRAHGYDRPADESFRRAQRLDANEFRWPYLLGVSLENVDPVEAERCLRRALAVAPDLALPRLPLAELLVAAGRSEEAATLFGEANELEPLNTRAMLGLARLESDAGRLAEAESLCRQAEEIAPQNRMVQELLARVLFRQGRREEAERLRRRLETMPQVETSDDPFVAEVLILRRDPNWIAVKAQTMLDQGLTQRAVEYLETVIANHPGRIRFPLQLARALGGAGRPAQARKVLERAVTEFPESAELRLVLGLVLGEMEELAEAAESFDAASQRKPRRGCGAGGRCGTG
jgi:tetratricopeptide (TPR) repeat protein